MPSEESRQEQAHALAVRAREALPQREAAALLPTGVEGAVDLLARAIECLTSDNLLAGLDLRGLDLSQFHRRGEPCLPSPNSFVISFPDIELPVSEIWPEGNAPEHPTPEDVIEVMRSDDGAHPLSIIRDWLLIESLFIRDSRDKEAEREVEWDGT